MEELCSGLINFRTVGFADPQAAGKLRVADTLLVHRRIERQLGGNHSWHRDKLLTGDRLARRGDIPLRVDICGQGCSESVFRHCPPLRPGLCRR